MNDSKENERDEVDNYIITTCITLIAAFIIILSINKPDDLYIVYSYLSSLFFLILSFLFFLWHKLRYPIRKKLFERAQKVAISNISAEIAGFIEEYFYPATKNKAIELARETDPQNYNENLKKKFIEEHSDKARPIIETYIEKLNFKLKEKSKEIFKKPLKENFSNLKHFLDLTAMKSRYHLFLLAILFFFLSIFLTVL